MGNALLCHLDHSQSSGLGGLSTRSDPHNDTLKHMQPYQKVLPIFKHFQYWTLDEVNQIMIDFQKKQTGYGYRMDYDLFQDLFRIDCSGNQAALTLHYDEYEAEKAALSGILLQLEARGTSGNLSNGEIDVSKNSVETVGSIHDKLIKGYRPLLIPSPYALWRAFGGRPLNQDQREIATTSSVSLIDVMCVLIFLCDSSMRQENKQQHTDLSKSQGKGHVAKEMKGANTTTLTQTESTNSDNSKSDSSLVNFPSVNSRSAPSRRFETPLHRKLFTIFSLFDTPNRGELGADNFEDLVRSSMSAIARILSLPTPPLPEIKLLLKTPLLSPFVSAASMVSRSSLQKRTKPKIKLGCATGSSQYSLSVGKMPLMFDKFSQLVLRSDILTKFPTLFQRQSILFVNESSGSIAPSFVQLMGYEFRMGVPASASQLGSLNVSLSSFPLYNQGINAPNVKGNSSLSSKKQQLQIEISKNARDIQTGIVSTQNRTGRTARSDVTGTSETIQAAQLMWPSYLRMGAIASRAAGRFGFNPKTTIKDVQYLSMLFDSLDPAGIGYVNIAKLKKVHSSQSGNSTSLSSSSSTSSAPGSASNMASGFSALRDIDLAVSSIFSDSGIQGRIGALFREQRLRSQSNLQVGSDSNLDGHMVTGQSNGINSNAQQIADFKLNTDSSALSDNSNAQELQAQVQMQLRMEQQRTQLQTVEALSQYGSHVVITLNEAKRLVASSMSDCESGDSSSNIDIIMESLVEPSDFNSFEMDLIDDQNDTSPRHHLQKQNARQKKHNALFISFPFMLDLLFCDLNSDQRRALHSWIPKQIDRNFVQRLQRLFDRIDNHFVGEASLSSCTEAMKKVDEFAFYAKRLQQRRAEIANSHYYSTPSALSSSNSSSSHSQHSSSLLTDSSDSSQGLSQTYPNDSNSTSGLQTDVKLTFRELLNHVLLEVPQSQWKRAQSWARPPRLLTKEQREALAIRFSLLDRGGRGKIPLSALVSSIVESNREEGINLTPDEVSELVRDVATDADGEIDLVEFQLFYRDTSTPVINFLLDCFDNPFFVRRLRQNRAAAAFAQLDNSGGHENVASFTETATNRASSPTSDSLSNATKHSNEGNASKSINDSSTQIKTTYDVYDPHRATTNGNALDGQEEFGKHISQQDTGSQKNARSMGKLFPLPPPNVPIAVSRLYWEVEQYRRMDESSSESDSQPNNEKKGNNSQLTEVKTSNRRYHNVLDHLMGGYRINEGINNHVTRHNRTSNEISLEEENSSTSKTDIPSLKLTRGITIGPSLRTSASLMFDRPKVLLSTGLLGSSKSANARIRSGGIRKGKV